ncbi:MAG TPA: hypothetical protein VFZ96_01025 [Actinomycetota bacterium]|nr:hypothetical protein [Actinomycetota bacterium]
MPAADAAFGWVEATIAFLTIALVGFLVSWVVTDRLHVPRTPYVAILTGAALALAAGYLAWSGTSLEDLLVEDWALGVVAGVVTAAVVVPMVRRLPVGPHPAGGALAGAFAWEGVVYGIGEALLLATLPVLALWHAAADLGWTDGALGRTGSGVLAIVGALVVIAVHHLGYAEFRAPDARPKLAGTLVGCGLQAVAFLVTGNVLAPVVAHIALHFQLILRGSEMPPVTIGPAVGRAT